ncbi:MAG TPA: S8 family serine peptidase, partial [Symbiobacteriaceae bacterium]|nr:S8 family serine peptidase [Symbiobacteriaceae bacterium]
MRPFSRVHACAASMTVAAMQDLAEGGFGLASFSSRGPTRDNRIKPDIGAPGVNIMAPRANSGNQYVSYSGTSMATPFVSGTVALMLDANPNLTVQQVRDILQGTAVPWGPEGKDVDYGWGRLDGYAAVKRAAGGSGGSGPAVPGHLYFEGNLASQGAKGEHSFTLNDVSYPVCVTLIMPNWSGSNNPDFDLYVFNPDGSELGRATGSNRQEQVTKRVTQTGTYKVEVRSYAGAGQYFLDVSAGAGQSTDQPPTVAFDQPAEGATVSGTVTVKVRATDDAAVSKVEMAVDGGTYADMTRQADGTYARDWETTGAANGAHTLTARATDSANQTATASRQVTVNNQTEPPP